MTSLAAAWLVLHGRLGCPVMLWHHTAIATSNNLHMYTLRTMKTTDLRAALWTPCMCTWLTTCCRCCFFASALYSAFHIPQGQAHCSGCSLFCLPHVRDGRGHHVLGACLRLWSFHTYSMWACSCRRKTSSRGSTRNARCSW